MVNAGQRLWDPDPKKPSNGARLAHKMRH